MKAFLIFFNFLLVAAAVKAATAQITFKESVEIASAEVKLMDLTNGDLKVSELENLIVDEAPAKGQTVFWSASELSQKLHPYKEALKNFSLKFPSKIKITRVEKNFSQTALEEKIRSAIKVTIPSQWEIKITDLQKPDWSSLTETAKWSVVPLTQRPKGAAMFQIVIEDQGKALKHLWINGRVEYFASVAITQKAVSAREKFNDYIVEKRNITYMTEVPASVEEIADGVAKLNMAAGMPITKSFISKELAVKFGEEVEMRVGNETFSIATKGVSQQNAYVGDVIKVRTSNNSKTVTGVVTSKGLVRVNL